MARWRKGTRRRLTDVYQEDIAGEGQEYVPPLPSQVKQRPLFHVDKEVVQ